MRIYPLIFILCCGLVAACSSVDDGFPCEETLVQELMSLQGITNPWVVEVKPPFLIIQNLKRNDSIFHIYDLTNYELKSAFGVKGQGPDEFISPSLFHGPFSEFLIGDFDRNQIIRFNIDKQGLPVFRDARTFGYDNALYDATFINDSLYIADPKYMLVPSLYVLSIKDSLPRKTWTYRSPDIMDYSLDPDMGNVYANENRIVFCYGYKKQIDFMDINFNLIKRVKFDFDTSDTSILATEDAKISYAYSYLGKRYLYALFLGTSWKEHRNNNMKGTILEVFDLDGNPVIRYHLDGKRPVQFAVDEETFTLYGSTEDGDPEDNLLVYKLKGLLNP